jgi:hypothetical protein
MSQVQRADLPAGRQVRVIGSKELGITVPAGRQVRRILEHLGLWAPLAAVSWPRHVNLPLTYHPVPDIA